MPTWSRRLGWAITLFLLWLLLAQSFHWQSLLTGAVVAVAVAVINGDLLLSLSSDLHVTAGNLMAWLIFGAHLVVDIVKAGLQVARLAFSLRPDLQPSFVQHLPKLKEPMMRVALANSITLTPGTLTVEAPAQGVFVVHALTREAGEGLKEWHIEKLLTSIERGQ